MRWETTNGDLAYLELDYALTNNGLVQTAQYGTTSINIPAGSSAGSYSASTKPYSGSAYKFAFRKSTLSSGANYIISKAGGTYVPVTYYFTQSTGYTGVVEAKSWTLQAKLSSYSDTTKPDIVFTPDSWTVNRQASSGSIIAAPALTVSKSNISFTGVPSWITMSVSSSVTLIPSYSGALTRNVTSGSSMTSVSGITFTVPSNTGATSSWTSPSLSSKYIPSSTSSTSGTVESGLYPTSTLSNVSSRDTTICVYMSGTYIGAMRVLQAGDSPSTLYYTVSTSSDGWSVGNTGNILARTAWTYTAPASNQFGYIYYYTYTTAYTYNYKYTYTHHYTYTTSYTYNYKYTYTTSYTYNYPYTYTYAYTYTTSYTYNTPYTLSSTSQSLSSDSTTSNGVHTWNNNVAYWRLNITLNYSAGTVSHVVGNTDKVQNGDPTKSGGSTHNDTTGSTTKTNTGRSDSTGSTLKVDDCSSNGYNHPKVTNNGYTSSEGSTTKTDTGTGINGNNSVKTGTFVVKSTSNALDGTSVNKTIYLYKSAVQDSSLDTTSITRNASITNTTTINYTADITRNASITNTATITRNASITNTATITKNATITPKASINYTSSYASVECSSSISNSSDFTLVGQTTSISSGGTTWTGVVYGKGDAFTTKSTTLTVNLTSNGSTKTVTQTFTINALTWTAHNS